MTDSDDDRIERNELADMRQADVDDLIAEKDKLIATLARLLREREWMNWAEYLEVECLSCQVEYRYSGDLDKYKSGGYGDVVDWKHKPGCELAAALAAAEWMVKP